LQQCFARRCSDKEKYEGGKPNQRPVKNRGDVRYRPIDNFPPNNIFDNKPASSHRRCEDGLLAWQTQSVPCRAVARAFSDQVFARPAQSLKLGQ
jgi:hypothetical protein